MPSRIARARARDAAALAALEQRCFGAADRFPLRTWRRLLGPAARAGSALTLVARAGVDVRGAIVGLLRANSRVLRIYSIAVDPAARGEGLGKRLIAALLRAAPRRCTQVSLEVRARNPARRLYEGIGMGVVRRLPRYYADGGAGLRYRGERTALLAALGRS